MILSGKEIHKQAENGNITIHPFLKEFVNPNSYSYRLDNKYTIVTEKQSVCYSTANDKLKSIPKTGLLLQPGKVYLTNTFEIIGSNKFVPFLIGRSSLGRLGLFLELSAEIGNLGPAHKWTLEMTCVQPIIIYPDMIIGQICFWVPYGRISEYEGLYTTYNIPKHSIISLLFGDK